MTEILLCKNCALLDIKRGGIVIVDFGNPDNNSRVREARKKCGEPGSEEIHDSLDQIVCTDPTKFKPRET